MKPVFPGGERVAALRQIGQFEAALVIGQAPRPPAPGRRRASHARMTGRPVSAASTRPVMLPLAPA